MSHEPMTNLATEIYVPVTVWHNSYRDDRYDHWFGYDPDRNAMTPVWTGVFPVPAADPAETRTAERMARQAWVAFNDGGAFLNPEVDHSLLHAAARAYTAGQNRSLSVGDVVQIGETYLAVAKIGFTEISRETMRVVPRPE